MENQRTGLMAELLGGAQVFGRSSPTWLDWVCFVRRGFPFVCAIELAEHLGLGDSELANMLHVSPVTLARRRRRGFLTTDESARVMRTAQILERAIEVFEAEDMAVDWLNHCNLALGDVTPLSLLDTEFGANEVNRILGTIEHGVFV
ncbi:DUF2384 domain-containing protein [Alcaligenaceae bacterium]|nr:DUF2384 domain-containing protein [Alcaligenaceae bacterium]